MTEEDQEVCEPITASHCLVSANRKHSLIRAGDKLLTFSLLVHQLVEHAIKVSTYGLFELLYLCKYQILEMTKYISIKVDDYFPVLKPSP